MADVERERVTALWREAAAALESGDYYYDHESGRYVYAPDRSAVDTCAECGRLREQLDARDKLLREALNAVWASDWTELRPRIRAALGVEGEQE